MEAAVVLGLALLLSVGLASLVVWMLHFVAGFIVKRAAAESTGKRTGPRLVAVTVIWLVAISLTEGYWVWSGWSKEAYLNEFNGLAWEAWDEAERIAREQGEVGPDGPIFTAEYGARYVQAGSRNAPATEVPLIANSLLPLWIICGCAVAIYYCLAFRTSLGKLANFAVSGLLAASQFFLIGTATAILSVVAYVCSGGTI